MVPCRHLIWSRNYTVLLFSSSVQLQAKTAALASNPKSARTDPAMDTGSNDAEHKNFLCLICGAEGSSSEDFRSNVAKRLQEKKPKSIPPDGNVGGCFLLPTLFLVGSLLEETL